MAARLDPPQVLPGIITADMHLDFVPGMAPIKKLGGLLGGISQAKCLSELLY